MIYQAFPPTAARVQWRATRSPWKAGEGHIFGPVDTLGVDPKVDSWPVDKNSLDGALDFFRQCLADKECNPYDDDYNEDTIFTSFLKYASFNGVKNSGFELSVKKEFKD